MKRFLWLGALLAGSAVWAIQPGRYTYTMKTASGDRSFIVQIPPAAAKSSKKLPGVMLLHGYTGSASAMIGYTRFGTTADTEGIVLVVPQGLGQPSGWNVGFLNLGRAGVDDIGFLGKLIDQSIQSYGIDPNRFYVAGHSNGAMMADELGAKFGNKIAAIASVSGTIGLGTPGKENYIDSPSSRLSVLHIHGRKDQLVTFDRSTSGLLKGVPAYDGIKWWANRVGISGKPVITKVRGAEYTTYSGSGYEASLIAVDNWGHDWPSVRKLSSESSTIDATDEIWKFFRRHSLMRPASSASVRSNTRSNPR